MLIEIKNIYKIYNEGKESEVRALDGVTLSIDRGEFVAIIGASGSGKSTLMNILGCLDVPTYGDYILNGTDVTDRTDRQLAHIRNKEIGFIFQGYNLIPALTAYENVELPLIYQGISVFQRKERVMAALERAWPTASATGPPRCPEASSSESPSPGPSPPIRPSSWPMSPPAPWTPRPASTFWRSSTASTREAAPSS